MSEKDSGGGRLARFAERLFQPVDIASIAVFRMMLGAVLFWEVWRYFDAGWIRAYYIEPEFTFRYYGFGWVRPWPGDWMYVHFAVVGACALCVMLGLWYRVTSALLFLGFTYWFLIDQTRYLNHLYLTALLLFLMALFPAHRARSIDAWRKPAIRSDFVPSWCLWLLRFQVGVVYFYAGVAKLTPDWLRGQPIGRWLRDRADMPLIGPALGTDAAVWFFGYGGMLFDLAVVPLLLWRRTRAYAFVAAVAFHITNKWLFDIGIFPHVMIAATLLFLPPDWPRRALFLFAPRAAGEVEPPTDPPAWWRAPLLGFLFVYAALQLLMPLRHFAYPGSVHWTEEGHRFAWHMKLRSKRAQAQFTVSDPATGESWVIESSDHLVDKQVDKFARFPDMLLQFAHHLAAMERERGHERVEVRARVTGSLNRRPADFLIDPTVDLASEPRNLWHADWILPLLRPLPAE